MGPLTGEAAFIGKEQLGFSRYAVRQHGGGTIRLVEADTQLDPARAARAARMLHARRDVLAVVGPAGSQEVLAVAATFKRSPRLPFVSGSALADALTNGSIPSFFRVVPKESAQAPAVARFVREQLKARRVAIVGDGSAYARRLADAVQARLRAGGVRVSRATDVAGVAKDTDAVFLPWRVAADAQRFGSRLRREGKQAVVVGSDSLDSGDFTLAGSYVPSFAPDARQVPAGAALVRGYGTPFVSNFGPPAYVATQAAIRAVTQACADGRATRGEVQRRLRATMLPRTALGRDLRFTAHGDAAGASYSIFKLEIGGRKTLVSY